MLNVAFRNLIEKQQNGKKGKMIHYETLQISDYLLPECSLSVSDKFELFAYRTEMNDLPNNFGRDDICEMGCLEAMDNSHLLLCSGLNYNDPHELKYEQLLNGNINEKVAVLKKLQENAEKRTNYLSMKCTN